jgi:hypothetical protein
MLAESELAMQREMLSNDAATQSLRAEAQRAEDQKRYLRELRSILDNMSGAPSAEAAARDAVYEQRCLALQGQVPRTVGGGRLQRRWG